MFEKTIFIRGSVELRITIEQPIEPFLGIYQKKRITSKFFELSSLFGFSGDVNISFCRSRDILAEKIEVNFLFDWVVAANHNGQIFLLDPLLWPQCDEFDVAKICIHELTHVVVNAVIPTCPLWLNEGLALFYADQIDTTGNKFELVNPYDTDYNSGIYENSGRVVELLIKKFGEGFLLEAIRKSPGLYNDGILGYEPLNDLLAEGAKYYD